ncbi:MAG: hypothetical protein QM605_07440 [Sphingobium sp.]
MAPVGWIISFVCLFTGLALRQDMPVGGSATLSMLLMAMALLACPMLWLGSPFGISRGQRIVAALAMLLSLPLILLPTAF